MNGQQIVDRCEERFGDTSNAVYTVAEWLSYANAAYRRFLRTVKPMSLVTSTTAAISANGRSVALPAVVLQGGLVGVHVSGTFLEPLPPDVPAKTLQHWVDRPTTPAYYRIEGARILVFPAWAAGGTLSLEYLAAPTAIGLATTPAIPETYHDALVDGALAQAYLDDGSLEVAAKYEAAFAAVMEAARIADEIEDPAA